MLTAFPSSRYLWEKLQSPTKPRFSEDAFAVLCACFPELQPWLSPSVGLDGRVCSTFLNAYMHCPSYECSVIHRSGELHSDFWGFSLVAIAVKISMAERKTGESKQAFRFCFSPDVVALWVKLFLIAFIWRCSLLLSRQTALMLHVILNE